MGDYSVGDGEAGGGVLNGPGASDNPVGGGGEAGGDDSMALGPVTAVALLLDRPVEVVSWPWGQLRP